MDVSLDILKHAQPQAVPRLASHPPVAEVRAALPLAEEPAARLARMVGIVSDEKDLVSAQVWLHRAYRLDVQIDICEGWRVIGTHTDGRQWVAAAHIRRHKRRATCIGPHLVA